MSIPSRPSDPSSASYSPRTFFVTSRTAGGRSLFQTERMASLLIDVLRFYMRAGKITIHDFVIMPNHVHILMTLPGETTLEKAMQLIKGGSTKWVHGTFPEHRLFAWQEKYGAFSASVSQLGKIAQYIQGQEEHHRKMTFQEEFLAFLKKHDIQYDERYLWE